MVDINTWNYASVNGTSIKDIVGRFVSANGVSALLPHNESAGLLMDDCAGPNCVVGNQPHACRPLLELENTYHEVNLALRAIWFGYMGFIVLLGILLRTQPGEAFSFPNYCGLWYLPPKWSKGRQSK